MWSRGRRVVVEVEYYKCREKSIMTEEGKGGTCSKATKGTPTERTGIPCRAKSTGRRKEVEENRGRRSDVCS